jgi:hypothetical protein
MKNKRFLDLVLAHEGYYCVWALKGVKPNEQIKQKFYSSTDEVLQAARDLDSNGWNAFFALGTFFDVGSRVANNMQWMKSFFLDLDCGPNKEFPSQAVAIEALRTFCENNELPIPTLINSGRGVHVYWILTEPVCREDWWPVAERLKRLCADQGFDADPSRTSDAAGVLRVPSTHNYKYDEPLPVDFYGIEDPTTVDFDKFAVLLGDTPIPVPKRREASAVSAFKDAMYQNYKGSFRRLLLKTKNGTGCDQIKYIIGNQGDVSHDLWRAGLSIANVCEDGAEAAHIMSAKHEDYNVQDTLRKMEDTGGPHFCSTIERLNPDGCDGCPNKGKITTPAQLTKEVKEATPEDNVVEEPDGESTKQVTIPALPTPYFRGQYGGVYLRSTDADGDPEEVCIYPDDFYVTRRLHDVELGEVIAFALHLPRDGVREFIVPLAAVTSREEFRKNMSMQGVVTLGKDIDKLMTYTAAWIRELQQTTTASEAHQQFGWVDDKKMQEFVLGDQLITANGVEYNPPSSKTSGYISKFKPTGTRERNKEILDFYDQDGMELQQLTVCAGFGTILMPLTGLYSLGIHLFGSTGGGKTTAMFTGTSIWGDPSGLTGTQGDTANSRMNVAEVMHNLLLNTDEMTNVLGKAASNYAYQLSEGKQKNRMAGGGNIERVRGRPWRLIAVSSGNVSMYAQMAMAKGDTKAEMQRLLELRVDEMDMVNVDPLVSAKLFADIQDNYGHFGPEFVQYVIANKEAITVDYERIKAELDKAAGLDQRNRFWSGGCSAILAGALAAKRAGIINYDMKKLFKWVAGQLRRTKAFVDDSTSSVQTLVTEFATEYWGSILKIKSTETAHNAEGVSPTMVIPEQNPRGMFVARYETDTHMLYIVPKVFKTWLGDQKLDYTSAVEGMQKEMSGKKVKMRLSKGTNFNLPPIWVLSVKLEGFSGVSETTEL